MCLDILPFHSTGYKRKREHTWYGSRESNRTSIYKAVRLTKAIIVYKIFQTTASSQFTSPYRDHEWVPGKLETAPMRVTTDNPTIEVGLHAFLRKRDAEDAMCGWHTSRCHLRPMVIPAGALVYFGKDGEIVSNQMIAFRDEAAIIKRYGGIGKKLRRKDIVETLPKLIKDY